ncbi:MAG: META domain-containing protein [Planctomycetes bacterium]|nr:META domain-containing protein [Planctomycetota bacterium]
MLSRSLSLAAFISFIVFGSLCTLSACQSTATMREGNDQSVPLIGSWTLATMSEPTFSNSLSQGAPPSLKFDEKGGVTGFSGVNRLSGGYDLGQARTGRISLGHLASTRMAGSPEAMRIENAFLTALSQADSFSIDGGNGILALKRGKDTLVTFSRNK